MDKIYKSLFVFSVIFGLAFSVLAQNPSPSPMRAREEVRETNREIQDIREDAMGEMDEIRQVTRMMIEEERRGMLQEMAQIRENLRIRIEAKRVELKTKLRSIRDIRKTEIVERIDKNMDDLNEKLTDHFLSVLEQLENVLLRIEERANNSEESGVDVSSVRSAINDARESIARAREVVKEQAAKTYVLTITTEDKLRTDIGKARQLLHNDLRSVFEIVKLARNAVHEAARTFAEANGRNIPELSPLPSVSPSVSPSPSV